MTENAAMLDGRTDRVPKAYRLKLHRLKNQYRKVKRQEPELPMPVTEEAAEQSIALLEAALRQEGISFETELTSRRKRRQRGARQP